MSALDVVTADASEVATIQERFLATGTFDAGRETYRSPDGRSVLVLAAHSEQPFGAVLFKATVRGTGGSSKRAVRLKGRLFVSPGRFGAEYDHWSGSPWSEDSNRVALVEVRKPKSYEVHVFDREGGGDQTLARDGEIFAHHMWSPDGAHYLYRDRSSWHLHSFADGRAAVVSTGHRFPKHCYFVRGGAGLLLVEDEDLVARLMTCEPLKQVAERPVAPLLKPGEKVTFSLPHPETDRVFLGVNPRFERVPTCERWLAIRPAGDPTRHGDHTQARELSEPGERRA